MLDDQNLSLKCTLPALLEEKIEISALFKFSDPQGNLTGFGIDLNFHEMHLSKSHKSSELDVLRGKIEDTLHTWEYRYKQHLGKKSKEHRSGHVDELNQETKEAMDALNNILDHTLNIDDKVDWDTFKHSDPFRIRPEALFHEGQILDFIKFDSYGKPIGFEKILSPVKPRLEEISKEYGFFSRLFRGSVIKDNLVGKLKDWEKQEEQINRHNAYRKAFLKRYTAIFKKREKQFEADNQRYNKALEKIKDRYSKKGPKAIEEYCDFVLGSSQYPDYFPRNWALKYIKDSRMAVVEYELPVPEQLPAIESYEYIKSGDKLSEKVLTEEAHEKLYNSVIYQICIRTIHELFDADGIDTLGAVVFNGFVTGNNPATDIKETKIIMSIMAKKEQFISFDLSQVDPKEIFKQMKGIAEESLIKLTPIQPIVQLKN